MTATLTYNQGATEPAARITLTDDDGNPADLSGATLSLIVGPEANPAFTKTAGLSASGGVLTVTWAATGELRSLTPGRYRLTVVAAATLKRVWTGSLIIRPSGTR